MRWILIRLTLAGMMMYSYPLFSQNLAPNFDFEDTLNCPTNAFQIYNAPPWFSPTWGSPDYFNSCSSNPIVNVPYNQFGYQIAKSGAAYAGFGVYSSNTELREYIEVQLLDSLLANKKYCIEFYVALADSSFAASKEIGIYFSQDSIHSENVFPLPVIPQIENDTVISDTSNWTLVSGEFMAQGGEKFITIGNFRGDANTTVINLDTVPCISPPDNCFIYYYIEDVSVYLCDCDTTPPIAKFNYTSDTLTATFNNLSSAYSNYWFWDFGDGNTSTEYNPMHTYDSGGVYTVTLVAWYNGCSDTMVASVAVNEVGVDEFTIYDLRFTIYPNPAEEKIVFEKDFPNGMIKISDLVGKKVYSGKFQKELSIFSFPKGIYIAEVITDKKVLRSKFVKE